jgi:hypothetical protein
MDKWMQFYKENSNFHHYVDAYCKQCEVTPAEAVTHKMVQFVGEMYEKKEAERQAQKDIEEERQGHVTIERMNCGGC